MWIHSEGNFTKLQLCPAQYSNNNQTSRSKVGCRSKLTGSANPCSHLLRVQVTEKSTRWEASNSHRSSLQASQASILTNQIIMHPINFTRIQTQSFLITGRDRFLIIDKQEWSEHSQKASISSLNRSYWRSTTRRRALILASHSTSQELSPNLTRTILGQITSCQF